MLQFVDICLCVCVFVCVYTFTHTHRHADRQTDRHIHRHAHTHIPTHTHLCMQTKMEQFVARERLGSVDENLSAKVKRVVLGPFMAQQDGEDQIGCALYLCAYIHIYACIFILHVYTYMGIYIVFRVVLGPFIAQ